MAANPLDAIAQSPMRWPQYVVLVLCCLINITDGFDIISLAYAAPVLTREWGTPAAVLGVVFSAAATGLALGAFFLAPLADKLGRRPLMMAALAAITVAHLFSALAQTVYELVALRFVMGLGLGVLVVSLNVMVSEYSNEKRRNIWLSILHSGFTVGMMLGGLVSGLLLEPYGWRTVFLAGAIINGLLLVVVIFWLKESPSYLLTRQPRNALPRVNRILASIGQPELDQLPPVPDPVRKKGSIGLLLGAGEWHRSALLWGASLTYAIVGYFLLNWKPQVLVDAGLTPTQASFGGIFESALGVFGHLAMGILTRPGSEARMTALFFALLGVSLVIFGNMNTGPYPLIAMGGVLKFFTVGAYTGVFLVAIAMYRPEIRTLGVGMVVGFGRVGAVIGPLLGGVLLSAALGRPTTFAIFAAISVLPIVAMLMLSRTTRSDALKSTTA